MDSGKRNLLHERSRDLRPQSLYASPWPGGWWRRRDAVQYMETASIATLDYAAKYRVDLLYNRYQAGRDTIRKYRNEPPYAYVVPQEQHAPVAAVELLRRLAFNGLRISRTSRDVTIDGIDYPAGTWVIPMDPEFAALARQLLDLQEYPDLAPLDSVPGRGSDDTCELNARGPTGDIVRAGLQPPADRVTIHERA